VSHSPQPELFSAGPAAPVDLAPQARAWEAVSERLPPLLRMGTSSWSFGGWEGLVWDRAVSERTLSRHGLRAYARHPLLRAVGVDRGYYSPVPRRVIGEYVDQVDQDFRFVWKADRRLVFPDGPGSDPDLFLNPTWADQEILGPLAEQARGKIGVLLFQFPPLPPHVLGGPRAFAESLYRFLDALTVSLPRAVEVRTRDLLGADYAAALAHGGAANGYVVHPEMPGLPEQVERLPPSPERPLLIRWMLQPGYSYASARESWSPFATLRRPDDRRRRDVAALIRAASATDTPTFLVVNNKAEGSAPLSIEALATALDEDPEATV